MKNRFTPPLSLLVLTGLLTGSSLAAQTLARHYVPKTARQERPAENTQSLHQFLTDLQTRRGILFLYKSQDLRERRVAVEAATDGTVEKLLKRALTPAGLRFKKVRNTYVIHDASEAAPGEAKPGETSLESLPAPASAPDAPHPFTASLLSSRVVSGLSLPEQRVAGRVTASETGEALAGVSVSVKGTPRGTTTDADGRYALTVDGPEATLVFSFVGYTPQEVAVGSRSALDVQLASDTKSLGEVVVVGYGTQKKVNLTGAIATVDQKFLENRPITNSTQALQGLPGVFVNQTKGRPGADGADIRIRGVGTLNGSGPLVLVDGIAYSLSDVNPNDIESISVLKDAASAAIYGNRAANGVILVKTKSGQKGKFRVDYNNYFGTQSATILPDVVWNSVEYMEGKNRALANEGRPAEYTQALIDEYKAGTDPFTYANTNWFDVMFRPAPIQEHTLRFSGGSDKTQFSVSLGYLDQKGIMLNTWAKRYTLGTNLSADLSNRFKIGASLFGTFWTDRESAYTADEGNGEGGIMGLTFRGLPTQAPYASNGTYGDQWVRVPGHNFFRNPLALSYEGFRKSRSLRTLATVFAEYRLPLDIRYKLTVSANIRYGLQKFAYPQIELTNTKTGTVALMGNIPARGVRQSSTESINLTNFHTLTWDKEVAPGHTVGALGGFSLETFDDANFLAANQGYLGNDLTELNAGSTNPQVGGASTASRLMSYFGRGTYNFRERYLLEASFRYDGSSRFAAGKRWGFFPSVSAGWRISEEAFLKNSNLISNLKLRASWGKLGNQNIPLFSYVDGVAIGQNYSFNNNLVGGAAVTQLSDPSISWERTTIADIGLDAGLLNNRLTLELDWFDKRTTDILRQVAVPAQVGNLTGPVRNIGSVSNKGVELTVNFRNRVGQVLYNVGGNVTYLTNRVLDLNGQRYFTGLRVVQEGDPIDSFFGLQAIGLFQSEEEIKAAPFQNAVTRPGDIRYRDVDGNNVIDNNDRVVIGNPIPKYTYTFTAGAEYRGFDLTLFFQGVQGVNSYLTGNLSQPYRNGAGVTRDWLTDSWTPENPTASLPRLTTATNYPQNFQTSSFWIRDASYLRLKNIQLGYSLPAALVRRVGLSRAKVFVNAQNYLTFTKFKFTDPERDLTRSDLIEYPIAKTATVGLNLTF